MQNIKKNSIDRIFLKNLVCPLTKSDLIYLKKEHELISLQSKQAYPNNRNIQLMHIDFLSRFAPIIESKLQCTNCDICKIVDQDLECTKTWNFVEKLSKKMSQLIHLDHQPRLSEKEFNELCSSKFEGNFEDFERQEKTGDTQPKRKV